MACHPVHNNGTIEGLFLQAWEASAVGEAPGSLVGMVDDDGKDSVVRAQTRLVAGVAFAVCTILV